MSATTTPTTEQDEDPKTSFLDLPLHIRNRIYHLALHQNAALELLLTTNKRLTLSSKPTPTTTLLTTNHQISSESSSILYSTNTFSFSSAAALKLFLSTINPESRKVLRSVRLPNPQTNQQLYKTAVTGLRLATNIRFLEICGRGYDAGEHVNIIKSLILNLRKLSRGRSGEELVGVVVILPGGEGEGTLGKEEAQEMTGGVREGLREVLDGNPK